MLTKEQYEYLKPYISIIKHVSFGGNTSKSDTWYAMNTINIKRTGQGLNGAGCPACMVDQYQKYWNLIQEYEASETFKLQNEN